jgi:excisionase family DNA binding protein
MSKESKTPRVADLAADAEAFLTIVEVSAELRCSSKTIRRQILEGRLRAVKFGGRYLIRPSDLKDFIGASHTLNRLAFASPQST